MGIIIDIIILGIIAAYTFLGYKQGIAKAVLKLVSFFIAIIVAFVLYKPVSNFIIKNTNWDENLKEVMCSNIKLNEENEDDSTNIMKSVVEHNLIAGTNRTIDEVAEVFSIKLIRVATIIGLYIITRIILLFITALTELITSLPLIKQINQTAGLAYGFLKGILIVFIILGVIYIISPAIKTNIPTLINETVITKLLYNHNYLLKLIF